MEELKKALQETYPDIDFDKEKNLYDDGIIDSVDVVTIISKLEELFDILGSAFFYAVEKCHFTLI